MTHFVLLLLLVLNNSVWAKQYVVRVDLSKEAEVFTDLQAMGYKIVYRAESPNWWLIDGPVGIKQIRSVSGVEYVEVSHRTLPPDRLHRCRMSLQNTDEKS